MRIQLLALALIAALSGCASSSGSVAQGNAAAAPDTPSREPAPVERSEKQVMANVDADNSIFFNRNSATLDDTGRALLREHAERLKANPKQHVVLAGFSDNTGSHAFSLALADKRVTTVLNQLRELGVPRKQLRRAVAGVEQNSKECQSEDCLRLMRRVEIRYVNPR